MTPTLDAGAADVGAVELVRILKTAGHRAVVVSRAGRLVADVTAAGGGIRRRSMSPAKIHYACCATRFFSFVWRANAIATSFTRSAAPAPGALISAARSRKIPFVTSWFKGFREQNIFKRLYNGVMVRGDRVVAVCEQLAQLVNDRYGTPWEKIAVVPVSIDFSRFDPAQ